MYTETRNSMQDVVPPPLPPAPVFSEEQMAAAQPVQPLPNRRWRKSTDIFQHIIVRRITAVAAMAAATVICVAIAAASVGWHATLPSAEEDSAQSISGSTAQQTEPESFIGSVGKKTSSKKRGSFSSRRAREVREMLPPPEFDEESDDPKPKARRVTIIH